MKRESSWKGTRQLLARLVGRSPIPPGHFYSPVPDLADVRRQAAGLFDASRLDVPGVNLNVARQLDTLARLSAFYPQQPFTATPRAPLRFHFDNPYYSYGDAIFLYGMIRLARPKRIMEIGSGYSSLVMLDTDEAFLNRSIAFTFIDPDDRRLRARLEPGDDARIEVVTQRVQDVPPSCVDALDRNDILFVDSSHVCKIGSDVNFIFSELLPRLKPGVFVHVHDIFYPFEYPQVWIEEGRFWNESYVLKSFLQFNAAFEIVVWNHFLFTHFRDRLAASMPLCLVNPGASLWLQRTG